MAIPLRRPTSWRHAWPHLLPRGYFSGYPFVKRITAVILEYLSLLPAITAFLRSKDEVTKAA
jgi:hypothetical protein